MDIKQLGLLNERIQWCMDRINYLEEKLAFVDDASIEEINYILEHSVKQDKSEILNRLEILIAHLLKCKYQPENVSSSWIGTIDEQRRRINNIAEYGGNVANYLYDNTTLNKAFAQAKKIFQVDTHISAKILPNICPFDINYILSDFIPVECKQYYKYSDDVEFN